MDNNYHVTLQSPGMLTQPWGVTVNERDEIAVTEVGINRVQYSVVTELSYRRLVDKVVNRESYIYQAG